MADLQRKTANLLNTETSEQGCYYDASGVYHSSTAHDESDYIPIIQGESYTFYTYKAGSLAYGIFINAYDSSKEFSSNIATLGNPTFSGYYTFVAPITGYVRFNYLDRSELSANTMFYEGSSHLPYEPYGWVHSLRKLTTATEDVENPLYSDGTPITNYTIKGNTVQNGTPTPSAPISVNGVGNKTANLYNSADTSWTDGTINEQGEPQPLATRHYTTNYTAVEPNTEYCLGGTIDLSGESHAFFYYDANKQWLSRSASIINTIRTFETPANCRYIRIMVVNTLTSTSDWMLTKGSTPKSFEPYGYKIPISNGQGSAVNYLGSVQSTRQIKKLVLTGEENITKETSSANAPYRLPLANPNYATYISGAVATWLCSHYEAVPNGASWATYDSCMSVTLADVRDNEYAIAFRFRDINISTADDFKAYLAQQYANGTPVTVWYVLQTATTATVNEPLMKIDTYADALSNATSIPTTEGANSITVDTTVQPSEFSATWSGWHNAYVKEKSENLLSFDELNSAPSGELVTQTSGSAYIMPHVLELTLEPNTTYTLSSNYDRTSDKQNIVYLQYADSAQSPNTSNSPTATTDNTGKIKIGFYDNRAGSDDFLNGSAWLMLNDGSTAQTYEPYWK